MKEIQKRITIIIWCCSIIFTIFSLLSGGDTSISFRIDGVMVMVSIIATILYFIPMSERVKAIIVLGMTGAATMAASVIVGGNAGTFLASFILIGAAVLYFDPVILIAYTIIHLTAWLIVYKLDPIYLVGHGMDSYMGIVMLFSYVAMTGSLSIATFAGQKYMKASLADEKDAQQKSKLIQHQSEAARVNSTALHEEMEKSEHHVQELSYQANAANNYIKQVRISEDETIERFRELMNKFKASTGYIEDNYKLIERLTGNFGIALEKVEESKSFSDNTQQSMRNILATIEHAYESILTSSKETTKIEAIINDINEIASQTNLLAMNAAIEAARVGEIGAGFDIVADQIRTLSVQSKDASENIARILSVLSHSLEDTNNKVQKGIEAVKLGMTKINHMVECIETIDLYSHKSQVTLNQEVNVFEQIKTSFAGMAAEVEKAMKSANTNLENLKDIAESIETQTDRTKQVSNQLNEIEHLSNRLMEQF